MTRDRSLDVAVTGLAGRFPGCPGIGHLWQAVKAGRVLTRRYERAELLAAGVPRELVDDPGYVPVHGHLDDADCFENTLFRVSPREAELTDPQHRLMLEAAWEALEDACLAPTDVRVTTAVFASASGSGYLRRMVAGGSLDPLTLEDVIHGNEPDFMAGAISYRLGLTGPALAVQTACSSSLVAVHLAARSLLHGECDQALVVAAGVPFPQAGQLHVPGGIHSPAGRCRPFDEHADGVVAGSGVACVVLRRLADVTADDPPPYGVILGSAVSNDGNAKAGFYAPSATGQEAVIRSALLAAGIRGDSVGYLETHGTGTRVGDPIEWSAAGDAYAAAGAGPAQIAVGALKANTGHLDNAAGLSSLIKALLVVRDGVIPPVAGFGHPNPLLEVQGSPLRIPRHAESWAGPHPRRAGVSSFGIGGTNAHVLLEQPPVATDRPARAEDAGRPRLLVLSAADPEALARTAQRLGRHLEEQEPALADVSTTLAVGRAALPERLAVAGRTGAEIAERLRRGREVAHGSAGTTPPPVVFALPGQGSQRPGMAARFARAIPGFDAALDDCLDAVPPDLAERLRRALLDPRFPADELARTELTQPALFALGHAAAVALRGVGIRPVAVLGHSLGDITAACLAGAMSLEDAARFVIARGRAMQQCGPGAMLALGCDETQARELVADSGGGIDLAAVNSPGSCVVAGPIDVVTAFEARVRDRVRTDRLRVARAFHSGLIEPAVPGIAEAAERLGLRPTMVPWAANVTGDLVAPGTRIDPRTFVDQARGTVRFAAGLEAVARAWPHAVVVELGPGRTLTAFAAAAGLTAVPLGPAVTAHPDDEVLTALGALWAHGVPLDLAAVCGGGRRVRLPGYPFAGPRWLASEARPVDVHHPPAAPPLPDAEDAAGTTAPDTAALTAGLWRDLLGHDDLAADSDFFALGGDSLLVTHLARRLRAEVGVRVPVRDLLLARTLGGQTELVRELLETKAQPGHPAGNAVDVRRPVTTAAR